MAENATVEYDPAHRRLRLEQLNSRLEQLQERSLALREEHLILSRALRQSSLATSPSLRPNTETSASSRDTTQESVPTMPTYVPSPPPRSRPSLSRSRQRRERRKRLRAANTTHDRPARPPPLMAASAKNDLGIISIRRKDFNGLTPDDVSFLIENIKKHGHNIDAKNTSIYKNNLRIFCDSKTKLQSVWVCTKNFPELVDHPGFCYALPGIKFSDMRRIECRVPAFYHRQYNGNPSLLVKSFLVGCPGFNKSEVKFIKMLRLKNCQDINKKVVLFMDVSELLVKYLRSKSFITKLDKKWRVKWTFTKRDKEYSNKEYKNVENSELYWNRKRIVSLEKARKGVNACYDFRYQL